MRRKLFFIIVLFLSVLLCIPLFQKPEKENILTEIQLLEPIIDFGVTKTNLELDVPVKLKNIGKHNLIIEKINNSCNCMNSSQKYAIAEPGDTITINIDLKPSQPCSYFEKIFVFCNVEDSPIPVVIRGDVIE